MAFQKNKKLFCDRYQQEQIEKMRKEEKESVDMSGRRVKVDKLKDSMLSFFIPISSPEKKSRPERETNLYFAFLEKQNRLKVL